MSVKAQIRVRDKDGKVLGIGLASSVGIDRRNGAVRFTTRIGPVTGLIDTMELLIEE